jgi:hypothetical protein
MAISPRSIRYSSICVTLRLCVQPVDAQGTTQVSGMSREASGPELPSRSEDVAAEPLVGAKPLPRLVVAGPVGSAGQDQADVAHRTHQRVVLEQGPLLLERALQLRRLVARAEPRPGDQVGVRRDRRRRVDLEQGQVLHHRQQVAGAASIQHLRAYGNPPRLLLAEMVHGPRLALGSRLPAPLSRARASATARV